MTLRPDTEIQAIRQHLDYLRRAPWIDPARQWWPDYLFHCTDLSNVVNILRQGEMVSRTQAVSTGQLALDIASPAVIAQTSPQRQNDVRLYFRPKTPTQYHNEGFRPVGQRSLNSHCPVPVYLIFGALPILSRVDCLFTDGNAGSGGTEAKGEIDFLRQIPFEQVYHVGSFNSSVDRSIAYHRNAEVLIPQRLGLDNLVAIRCRSQAEYETLLYRLPRNTLSSWANRIGVLPDTRLFHREWPFVEQVEMSAESLVFRFNRSDKPTGGFVARAELVETETGDKYSWSDEDYQIPSVLTLQLRTLKHPDDYTIHLTLDNNLAYANRYQEDDLPF